MSAPTIRRATFSDIDALAYVHSTTWRATYRGMVPDDFLDELTPEKSAGYWKQTFERMKSGSLVFALEIDDTVVGYTSGGPARELPEVDGEIYTLYLLPECHGEGFGALMLRHLLDALRATGFETFGVWVLLDNPARDFYAHMGAVSVRTKEITVAGESVIEELWVLT